jgi:eukaryotic-like serine/threonine-protein kinase
MTDYDDRPRAARWKRADRIFSEAMEQPPARRDAFVRDACAGDAEALADVHQLLKAAQASEGLFEAPGQTALDEAMADLDGRAVPGPKQIGPYAILNVLGRGGMGTVYLAEREGDGFRQRVAIKVLRRGLDTADIVGRFLRERRILGGLTHPGIARLIDGGATDDGRPYLVMEYVEGEAVTDWCDRERADVRRRLSLFLEVADAVRAAHASLVVHRDLKPSNILVSNGRVKLLDFGIAKLLTGDDAAAEHTRTGLFVLTPEIASPEQLRGAPVTTATDVYQLGVLLCQLLTGARPSGVVLPDRAGASVPAGGPVRRPSTLVARDAAGQSVARLRATSVSQLRRTLRGDLDTIALKALHEDPERRYASVDQLVHDVGRFLEGRVISARPDTWAYRGRAFARRHPWLAPVASVALVGVVGYMATLTRYAVRLAQERTAAREQAERATAVQTFLVDVFRSPDPYDPMDASRGRQITVLEALDLGVERLRTELTDRPIIREALLLAVADVYQNLNAVDRALPLREEALALQEARAPGSADLVENLGRLARLRGQTGPEDEASALYARWLALAQALDPPRPAEVAEAHIGLGLHALARHELADAAEQFDEAIALSRGQAIPPSVMAEAYRSRADVHQAMGQLDAARDVAEKAVALRVEADGEDAVETALARVTLAQVLVDLRRLSEADTLYGRAIDTLERRLGADHRLTLVSLNSLALLRQQRGDFEGAITLLRRLVESERRVHGEHDKLVGDFLQNLATVLGHSGRLDEARDMHMQAADVYRLSVGPDSYFFALPYLSLANIELSQQHYPAAEAAARTALRVLQQALPQGHFVTAVAECRVARALVGRGRAAAAAPLFDASATALVSTESVPEYRKECLTAAASYFDAHGDPKRAADLREALAGG